jgi:phosphoribosylglycinamide formyltransferase-1
MKPLPVVALISGNGSNLQAIIDRTADGWLPIDLRLVISNEPTAFGLKRAQQAGIATCTLNHRDFSSREAYDAALLALIDSYHPGLIILAGFMRILTPGLVAHYQGRMLNIHPSLLPNYRGLHTHVRALAAGATEHGASVHFVTATLDGGPVIIQARVAVLPKDDPDMLAARVLKQEHRIYPQVIKWFAEGRLQLAPEGVMLDKHLLIDPVRWEDDQPNQIKQ